MQAAMSSDESEEQRHKSIDTSACSAKHSGLSDLVICLTEQFNCPCMVHYGMGRFCCHPDSIRIAKDSQTD